MVDRTKLRRLESMKRRKEAKARKGKVQLEGRSGNSSAAGLSDAHSDAVSTQSTIPTLVQEVMGGDTDEPPIDRSHGFTLVAIPDIFMTLETMEKALAPLKKKYPDCTLVYVGLPGLPNTHWPRGWILNADLHARCIAVLMQFLVDTEKISPDKQQPLLFFGFGSGSCCLSRFCAAFLPAMLPLYRRVKLVSLVNGFINPGQGYKKVCTELKDALLTANEAQMRQLVCSLYLWDEYIDSHGLEAVQTKFWKTRSTLYEDGSTDDARGSSLTGVFDMIQGLLLGPDDLHPSDLLELDLPLLVIQGTENVFVDPRHASIFQADKLPEGTWP